MGQCLYEGLVHTSTIILSLILMVTQAATTTHKAISYSDSTEKAFVKASNPSLQ